MRKLLSAAIALAAFLPFASNAEVLKTRPAGNPDGKLLTMEEAVLSRSVSPKRAYCRWTGDNSFSYYENGEWQKDSVGLSLKRPRPTAFSKDGSFYVVEGRDTTIVAEGTPDAFTFGETVSRNEFGINDGWFFSPSGRSVAFYMKDERLVTSFPLLDITSRTGTLKQTKYPMAGMDSEKVKLLVYQLDSKKTTVLDVQGFTPERYITCVTWSPDEKDIYAVILDRSQHHARLDRYDAGTGSFKRTLLTEDNDAWVEPFDPLYFLKGRSDLFLYRTDNRDGWRNLYLVDTLGRVRRLTGVDADVKYVANDGKSVWYTSAEVSPVENHLFRIDLTIPKKKASLEKIRFGKPVRLTKEEGWHDISMNPLCTWFFDSWTSFNFPGKTLLRSTDGKQERVISTASDPLEGYASVEMEFGTVKSADDRFDNYYRLYKPLGFDPAKKYPLIVYVYGGPHSQLVNDRWLGNIRMWEMLMAQKGYVVYVQDNRGTENRGAAFEKAINRRCGEAEAADQMEGIKMLCRQPWVDADRIGVHGWSYGGFMTITLMTRYPDTFKVGVAGGPVIDWKWYEVMYGERYMDTPQTNPEGYEATGLVSKASNLKGRLLICQGAVDKTVVWQHSLNFVQECVHKGIPLDYFPYPVAEHNVMGRDRIHLMDKVTRYFEDFL
ncbi:MAG: S9 family peptidase [Bacteroidales bacterium]|nr:S9 family peptidase [Bacteroidales bacterium]